MEYWVDGYNLILRKGWDKQFTLAQSREKLLRAVVPSGMPTRIYFDASRDRSSNDARLASPSTKVTPVFVRSGSADDAMIADLRKVTAANVTLVTDDRELRGRARQVGANALGIEKFLERIDVANAPPPPPRSPSQTPPSHSPADDPDDDRPKRVSKQEVDDWMKAFGITDDWKPEDDAPQR